MRGDETGLFLINFGLLMLWPQVEILVKDPLVDRPHDLRFVVPICRELYIAGASSSTIPRLTQTSFALVHFFCLLDYYMW